MKRTTRLGLVVLLAVAAVWATAGSASAGGWRYYQLDSDRCYDLTTLDQNGNGYAEVAWFDVDNDCDWDTKTWNSVGGDAFLESMTLDMDEDSHWEYWLADTDQLTGFEVVYFDYNRDGYYDRWAYLPQSAPDISLRFQLGQATTVGGRTAQDGIPGLLGALAGVTRRAIWSSPDYDNDGCPDGMDRNNYNRNANCS